MAHANVYSEHADPPVFQRARIPAQMGEPEWETLERQDWHLWVVAILLMFVLAVSLLSFMFPSVFWATTDFPWGGRQRAFFGFCILFGLTLIYVLQRQNTIRRLRRELFRSQAVVAASEEKVQAAFCHALPGETQFHDSLAMEYLRASRTETPLSLLLVETADDARAESGAGLGRMLSDYLRPGEALFRLSGRLFTILLPATPRPGAERIADGLTQRVREALGEGVVRIGIAAYPQDVASLNDLEFAVKRRLE